MYFLPINLTLPLFNVARRPRPAPRFESTMSKPVAPEIKRFQKLRSYAVSERPEGGHCGPPCQSTRFGNKAFRSIAASMQRIVYYSALTGNVNTYVH